MVTDPLIPASSLDPDHRTAFNCFVEQNSQTGHAPRAPKMRLLYCPPLPLLWSAKPDDGTSASRIHKIYLRGLWRRRWTGRLGVTLSVTAWPFIVLTTAMLATAMNGRSATRRGHRSLAALLLDQLCVAAKFGILPLWYFIYELDRPERRRIASAYILRHEVKGGLHKLLRYYAGSRGDKTLNDKFACYRACRNAGLATPEIFVTLRNGEEEWIAPDHRLPDGDLFIKPIKERGGTGAERWLLARPGHWRNNGGVELNHGELLAHLRRRSKRWPLLVQQNIENHPSLADLNCGALATVRVLCIWDENCRPEITNAAFKMPARPGSIVDNFCAGSLAASVDLSSGKLGPATNFGLAETLRWHDAHPVTGSRIEGRQLPMWPEVVEFSRRAHETFIKFPTIGLDIAITADGPYLIEANASTALDLIQRTLRAPIGNDRFGQLFALHLERAQARLSNPVIVTAELIEERG